jgi:hypothetical protein
VTCERTHLKKKGFSSISDWGVGILTDGGSRKKGLGPCGALRGACATSRIRCFPWIGVYWVSRCRGWRAGGDDVHAGQQEAARPHAGGRAVDAEPAGRRKGRKGTWGRAGWRQKVGKDGQNGDARADGDCKVCLSTAPLSPNFGILPRARERERVGHLHMTHARNLYQPLVVDNTKFDVERYPGVHYCITSTPCTAVFFRAHTPSGSSPTFARGMELRRTAHRLMGFMAEHLKGTLPRIFCASFKAPLAQPPSLLPRPVSSLSPPLLSYVFDPTRHFPWHRGPVARGCDDEWLRQAMLTKVSIVDVEMSADVRSAKVHISVVRLSLSLSPSLSLIEKPTPCTHELCRAVNFQWPLAQMSSNNKEHPKPVARMLLGYFVTFNAACMLH